MESARNTFADELRQAEVQELTIADLMGHKGSETMTGQRYVKTARLPVLAAAVERFSLNLDASLSEQATGQAGQL
jgi:hypothetical protein